MEPITATVVIVVMCMVVGLADVLLRPAAGPGSQSEGYKRCQQELTWMRENYTNLRRRVEFLESAVGPLEEGGTVIYRNAEGNIVRADIVIKDECNSDYVGSDDLSDK